MVNIKDSGPFDVIRYIGSATLLCFSIVVTFYALLEQKTGFWQEVPGWGALLLFIGVLFWLGVVEGLQLALVELKRQKPETYRDSHPTAYRLGEIASKGDNIEKFLMGRQVIVVFLVFFAAKLTSVIPGQDFLFPVPAWASSIFLETGLLASIVVVIIAQLTPQIISALYPVQFMELRLMRPVYYMCIFLEFTGLTHFCWLLAHLLSMAAGMSLEKEGPGTIDVRTLPYQNPGYQADKEKNMDMDLNENRLTKCPHCHKEVDQLTAVETVTVQSL